MNCCLDLPSEVVTYCSDNPHRLLLPLESSQPYLLIAISNQSLNKNVEYLGTHLRAQRKKELQQEERLATLKMEDMDSGLDSDTSLNSIIVLF